MLLIFGIVDRISLESSNQIQQQSGVVEKLRHIKCLNVQFILETTTDIKQVVTTINRVAFEPKPNYRL